MKANSPRTLLFLFNCDLTCTILLVFAILMLFSLAFARYLGGDLGRTHTHELTPNPLRHEFVNGH